MAGPIHPTTSRGARIFWLLDLSYAGQVFRLSDAELDVVDEDGASHHYDGTIDTISVDEGIDFLADASTSPASAAVDAVLPVDVPLLVAQGHDLGAATATLSRWVEGTTLEARRVLIDGQLTDPEYGAADEPIAFSVERAPWQDSSVVPAPGLAVLASNWDPAMIGSIPGSGRGLSYPIVIGHPGKVSTSVYSSGRVTGSQGVYVDQATVGRTGSNFSDLTILLAGHHVGVASVFLNTNTANQTDGRRYHVVNGFDRAGNPIAFCPWWFRKPAAADDFVWDATYSGAYTWGGVPSATVTGAIGDAGAASSLQAATGKTPSGAYVAWSDLDTPSAGGLPGIDGKPMRAAGDVLEWLLTRSGIPVDLGRFNAARDLLAGFRLDFTIDAQVTPWEFIQANILPILPVSIVAGPNGLYPIVWRYDAVAADAVARLDTSSDPTIERASVVNYDRSGVSNDFSLNYALSVRTGNYAGTLRYAADGITGATPSYFCTLSARRYLRPDGSPLDSAEVIESPVIYEDATAHAVLQWMTRARALARRRVTYIAPESEYGWMERGQVVTLTDADLHMSDQVALLESVTTDGSGVVRFGLLLIEAPIRDSRLPT